MKNSRMYCFPYAGGGISTYAEWGKYFGKHIDICPIQLPGRGALILERPLCTIAEIIGFIMDQITFDENIPFFFMGHSMGSLIAYELCHHLRENGLFMPKGLIASAFNAPRHKKEAPLLHRSSDSELIESLMKYNGTPVEILDNMELMEFILPTIRADFAAVETYEYTFRQKLDIPILVLAGAQDPYTSDQKLRGWHDETNGKVSVRYFDGDHFFINSNRMEIVRYLQEKYSNNSF